MTILGDQKINIPRSDCGRKTIKTICWLKTNDSFTCACGRTLSIDRADVNEKIAIAEKLIDDLKNTVFNIFRK